MSAKQHKHLTASWEAKGDAVFAGKDCIALCDTDNASPQVYEAKARLMAAAPELLAALQACTNFVISEEIRKHGTTADVCKEWVTLKRAARLAIDKATVGAA